MSLLLLNRQSVLYSFSILVIIFNFVIIWLNPFVDNEGFHIGHVRIIYMAVLILIIHYYYAPKKINIFLYIYLIYFFSLVFLSSNFIRSIDIYLKYSISLLIFIVFFSVIKDKHYFRKFAYLILATTIASIILFVIYQLVGLGESVYAEDSVLLPGGGLGVYLSNVLGYNFVFLLGTILYARSGKKYNIITFITLSITLLIIVLIFRRSVLLGIIISSFIIIIPSLKKRKSLIIILIGIIFIPIFLYNYYDYIIYIYEARGSFEETLGDKDYRRNQEIQIALKNFVDGGIRIKLIGSEIFNTYGYFRQDRPIHNDFATIIMGTGLIGIILFGFVHVYPYYYLLTINKHVIVTNKDYIAVLGSLLFTYLIISAANQIWVVTSLSHFFSLYGALFSIWYNKVQLKDIDL